MVKRSPTLGTLVSTKTKCIKLIFIEKMTLVPVAFLMALSIVIAIGQLYSTSEIVTRLLGQLEIDAGLVIQEWPPALRP